MTVGNVLNLPPLFGENQPHGDSSMGHSAVGGAQYVAISPTGIQTRFNATLPNLPLSLELTEQGFYTITSDWRGRG